MSQYVYTVIDPSGNSISVADQTYVNTAVTNAQIADNLYADNATSKVKTEINTTVNTLVANAVAAVLPQIPIGANVITASCKLKIVKPAVPAVGTTPAIPEETVILT